LDHQLIKQLAD